MATTVQFFNICLNKTVFHYVLQWVVSPIKIIRLLDVLGMELSFKSNVNI